MKIRRILIPALAATAMLLSSTGCRSTSPRGTDTLEGAVYDEVDRLLASVPYRSGPALLQALDQIQAFGPMAKAPLREALHASHPQVRSAAAYVLGRMGDPEVIDWLEPLEEDPDAGVRYESASSRIALGDWTAVGVLIRGLEDPDRRHRYQCYEVLTQATGLTFGYDFAADPARREAAAMRWRRWWNEVSEAPRGGDARAVSPAAR